MSTTSLKLPEDLKQKAAAAELRAQFVAEARLSSLDFGNQASTRGWFSASTLVFN